MLIGDLYRRGSGSDCKSLIFRFGWFDSINLHQLISRRKRVWFHRRALEALNAGSNPAAETSLGKHMLKHEWYAKNGSVFSTRIKQKCNNDFRLGKVYKYQDAVVFNVGDKVAKHIVELHNASLK